LCRFCWKFMLILLEIHWSMACLRRYAGLIQSLFKIYQRKIQKCIRNQFKNYIQNSLKKHNVWKTTTFICALYVHTHTRTYRHTCAHTRTPPRTSW
jgi:hypothetical protein